MSVNLVESIQKNLGYQQLHKIDPNSQDVRLTDKVYGEDGVSQAAIPAVLSGMYTYVQTEAVEDILRPGNKSSYTQLIFGDRKDQLIKAIAEYAGTSVPSTEKEVAHIADEAVRLVSQQVSDEKDPVAAVRKLLNDQKETFLTYLPAALQTGYLLGANTLDDNTHKMEGPISSLMHKMEKSFNSPERP